MGKPQVASPLSVPFIQGNNSVFARKFWNSQRFTSLRQLHTRLRWFNESSRAYSGYDTAKRRRRVSKRHFVPKVYFLRQVREAAARGEGMIEVLNEHISLPKAYINYFVLAEWNLTAQRLHVRFEQNQRSKVIKSIAFKINPNSKYRLN